MRGRSRFRAASWSCPCHCGRAASTPHLCARRTPCRAAPSIRRTRPLIPVRTSGCASRSTSTTSSSEARPPGHQEDRAADDGIQVLSLREHPPRRHRDDAQDQQGTARPSQSPSSVRRISVLLAGLLVVGRSPAPFGPTPLLRQNPAPHAIGRDGGPSKGWNVRDMPTAATRFSRGARRRSTAKSAWRASAGRWPRRPAAPVPPTPRRRGSAPPARGIPPRSRSGSRPRRFVSGTRR